MQYKSIKKRKRKKQQQNRSFLHLHGDIKLLDANGNLIRTISKYHPTESIPDEKKTSSTPIEREDRESNKYAIWRYSILKRDGFQCVLCNSYERIIAHHIDRWADSKKKRFAVQNGVAVCHSCHQKHHGQDGKKFPGYITNRLVDYLVKYYCALAKRKDKRKARMEAKANSIMPGDNSRANKVVPIRRRVSK